MCYDDNARPPLPPGESGSAYGEDIILTAADGNRFAAYSALPASPKAAQVLIFPDVRGVHQFYKELALRFAEVGIGALAIDYFGRTAGLSKRDDSFEFWPHVQQLRFDTLLTDISTALKYLRQEVHVNSPIFTIGFCMGGTISFLTGTQVVDLAGLIGFYSGMTRNFPGSKGTLLDVAEDIKYPVLG